MTRLKIFLLVLLTSAMAMAEVVPVPPRFIDPVQLPGEDPFSISKPAFSPDGAYVAAFVHGAKMLTVWDVKTQKVVAEIPESVKNGLEIIPVSRVGEVLSHALTRMPEPIEWTEKDNQPASSDKIEESVQSSLAH